MLDSGLSASVITDIQGKPEKEIQNLQTQAQELKVLKYISRIINNNENLQHLDLTNTGLNEDAILQLCERAKKSKTLQSVHFCGNPGITPRIKNKVLEIFDIQRPGHAKENLDDASKED